MTGFIRQFLSWKRMSRMWFYFRTGYGTYLTFPLGFVTTTVTVYYLAMKNVPYLTVMFPTFIHFFILAVLVGTPLGILLGWYHFKLSRLYASEQDISVESNPYYHKLPPGYSREVYAPINMYTLEILARLGAKNTLIREEEMTEIERLKAKLKVLCDGGFV